MTIEESEQIFGKPWQMWGPPTIKEHLSALTVEELETNLLNQRWATENPEALSSEVKERLDGLAVPAPV